MLSRHRTEIDDLRRRAADATVADMLARGVLDDDTITTRPPTAAELDRVRAHALHWMVGYAFIDPATMPADRYIRIDDADELAAVLASWRPGTLVDPAPGRICVIAIVT